MWHVIIVNIAKNILSDLLATFYLANYENNIGIFNIGFFLFISVLMYSVLNNCLFQIKNWWSLFFFIILNSFSHELDKGNF